MNSQAAHPAHQPPQPQLNAEQQAAVDLMLSGANVFLTGGGGTGKSTIIHSFRHATTRKVVIVAPTGAAASQIGGTTIHRTFQLISRIFLPNYEPHLSQETLDMLNEIDTLIIDEVSMVRADIFHAIDLTLRHATENHDLPFGGKQIIVVGDMLQLPPVARDEDAEILQDCYGGVFCFNSPAWNNGRFHPVILKQVHRQADPVFIGLLNAIRTGGWDPMLGIDNWQADWVDSVNKLNRLIKITGMGVPEESIVLCARNITAKAINLQWDRQLNQPIQVYQATTSGAVDFSELQVEPILSVRLGSRVIMLANKTTEDQGGFDYTNGDQGAIILLEENAIVVRLDKGREVRVARQLWECKKTIYDRERQTIRDEVVGRCWQIPAKLGYALSTHKSQGMSLDRVHLHLDKPAFAAGMLYVALSRCRSLQGLSMSRPIFYEDVIRNPEVDEFYSSLRDPPRAGTPIDPLDE